jgi:hypothetical protein
MLDKVATKIKRATSGGKAIGKTNGRGCMGEGSESCVRNIIARQESSGSEKQARTLLVSMLDVNNNPKVPAE